MSKSRIFMITALGFAGGVFAASRWALPVGWAWPASAAAMCLSLIAYRPRKPSAAVGLFCVSALAAGIGRVQATYVDNEYQGALGAKQQLEGVVVADIDRRVDRQQLEFRPDGRKQTVLIITSLYQSYSYGDRLLVTGKLVEPKASSEFDYRAYLQKANTYALLYYPKVIVLRTHQGNKVMHLLLRIKYVFIERVSSILDRTQSNLLLGILIGARKGLPQNVIDDFTATGTSHIIAISGYNISVIVGALEFLARYVGRRINFWLTLAVVAAFVIVSGASASVLRAALMGAILVSSSRLGRLYVIGPALCLAAVVMLLINPRILYWDLSFQLSFLATLGIVYGVPVLEQAMERWPRAWGIKSIFLTTLAAITATLPLILFQFGRLSIIAPLINIAALPVVPLTMLLGFLTALPLIGAGFGLFASWLLDYLLWVTAQGARLSWASTVININEWQMVVLYALIVAAYFFLRRSFPAPRFVVQ